MSTAPALPLCGGPSPCGWQGPSPPTSRPGSADRVPVTGLNRQEILTKGVPAGGSWAHISLFDLRKQEGNRTGVRNVC
jgi:hypothetical protein